MNKKINKVKSIVAAALLLLLCMCFLCACTPEEKKQSTSNTKYVTAEAIVKQIIVTITEAKVL